MHYFLLSDQNFGLFMSGQDMISLHVYLIESSPRLGLFKLL